MRNLRICFKIRLSAGDTVVYRYECVKVTTDIYKLSPQEYSKVVKTARVALSLFHDVGILSVLPISLNEYLDYIEYGETK